MVAQNPNQPMIDFASNPMLNALAGGLSMIPGNSPYAIGGKILSTLFGGLAEAGKNAQTTANIAGGENNVGQILAGRNLVDPFTGAPVPYSGANAVDTATTGLEAIGANQVAGIQGLQGQSNTMFGQLQGNLGNISNFLQGQGQNLVNEYRRAGGDQQAAYAKMLRDLEGAGAQQTKDITAQFQGDQNAEAGRLADLGLGGTSIAGQSRLGYQRRLSDALGSLQESLRQQRLGVRQNAVNAGMTFANNLSALQGNQLALQQGLMSDQQGLLGSQLQANLGFANDILNSRLNTQQGVLGARLTGLENIANVYQSANYGYPASLAQLAQQAGYGSDRGPEPISYSTQFGRQAAGMGVGAAMNLGTFGAAGGFGGGYGLSAPGRFGNAAAVNPYASAPGKM